MVPDKRQPQNWLWLVLRATSAALALAAVCAPGAQAQKETVLLTFTGGATGFLPYGGLVRDEAGNLYGTASQGGGSILCSFGGLPGCGVVFKLDPGSRETLLHSFTGFTDGVGPFYGGSMARDAEGNLYGALWRHL